MHEIESLMQNDIKTSESENKKEEIKEDFLQIQEKLNYLKNKDNFANNPDKYKQESKQFYKDFSSFFINRGAEFITNVNDIYKQYQNKHNDPLVVRREDPGKVTELIEGKDINLKFDPKVTGDRGDKYANSAIWPHGTNPVGGIKNAFIEGRGMAGPFVTLVGVNPNQKNNELKIPEKAMMKVGDLEREAVRIFSGKIEKEDLEFIILRTQKDFFPEENLTKEEKKANTKQIFRAFKF